MPKRSDLKKIMLIGSGPIIIGQACEFDYSGTQACKALREEGYEVVLINSNPATIMTDPEVADRTYIEPITPEVVEKIIAKERPDALLPTLGGQTALNTAIAVAANGVLDKYNVELIGASVDAINKAEERDLFKTAMEEADVECLESIHVHTVEEAEKAAEKIGFPVIIRPSFTLGGTGGGTAQNMDELRNIAAGGLKASEFWPIEATFDGLEVDLEKLAAEDFPITNLEEGFNIDVPGITIGNPDTGVTIGGSLAFGTVTVGNETAWYARIGGKINIPSVFGAGVDLVISELGPVFATVSVPVWNIRVGSAKKAPRAAKSLGTPHRRIGVRWVVAVMNLS